MLSVTSVLTAGARLTVAQKMNAELYGGPEPPSPATILDYRRTKRPPPFERLAAVRSCFWTTPCLYAVCFAKSQCPCPRALCRRRDAVTALVIKHPMPSLSADHVCQIADREWLCCPQELEQMLEGAKPVEGRNENFMKAMPYYFQ